MYRYDKDYAGHDIRAWLKESISCLLMLISVITLFVSSEVISGVKTKMPVSYPKYQHPITTLAAIKKHRHAPIYRSDIVKKYQQQLPVSVQGLALSGDELYTSSGGWGKSFLRRSVLVSGAVIHQKRLSARLFAEGISIFKKHLYQVMYQAQRGYIYTIPGMKKKATFIIKGEGWGLTHNQRYLIMSNGSSQLQFLDPAQHFHVAKILNVHTQWGSVNNINALLYYRHQIYANIWFADVIAIISEKTGLVTGWIDLSRLRPMVKSKKGDCWVANGIAWDKKTQHLIVTGKCWNMLYDITYKQQKNA